MITNFLRNRDAFGHQVNLRVKSGNGVEQTSNIGGTVTILIYTFIFVYMMILGQKMYESNLDIIMSFEEMIDFDSEGV